MFIIYNDRDREPKGNFSIPNLDPNMMYLKHFDNSLYLKFIANKSDNTFEKIQAGKELVIAEKKMKFWENKSSFDKNYVFNECQKLKAKWN